MKKTRSAALDARAFLRRFACWGPFVGFFRTHGWLALVMLSGNQPLTGCRTSSWVRDVRIPITTTSVFRSQTVGAVRGSIGSSLCLQDRGGRIMLAEAGYMQRARHRGHSAFSRGAAYATLAFAGTTIPVFALVMVGDNFGISFAGVGAVTYTVESHKSGYTSHASMRS